MKQLFCVIYVFSQLLFQLQLLLMLLFMYLFHLFWRANQFESLKTFAGVFRFVSKVGHLWYFMGLSRKISVENRSPFCPYETSPHCFAKEKVGETPLQWRPLLFLLRWFWELTNTFVLKKYFLFFRFFSIVISTEKNVFEVFISSVFSSVKC